MMETSKSDENQEIKNQDTKISVDNQKVVAIIDTSVEREIQNVLITSETDQNQPSCSWKVTEQHSPQIDNKERIAAKVGSTSSVSISIDVHCPPFNENSSTVQENIHPTEPTGQEVSHDGVTRHDSSLTNLFDDLQALGPITITIPEFPETNQLLPQSPIVTNQTSVQSPPVKNQPGTQPPVTKQPRAQPPEAPPTTNMGIHVVNIPNDSINRSLSRADPMLGPPPSGPPPSYSKSLLDRRVNTCASIQFVAPIPPPSYDGMENELRYAHTLGHTGGFTLGLGNTWQGQPQPAYCPVCETVIITQVDIRVSRIAHIVAMVMFLLLCWPFCLLPYFLNVCNYTFHYCSLCHSYLGARRPFQRG